jgi:hypothetical protein
MQSRNYWLDLFTGTTWQEFLDAGGKVSGFRESRWKTVQRMKPGDYLLCYLTGVSRFIGVLEVASEPYKDTTPIWKDYSFPSRVRVQVVVALTPETAVPIQELERELSIFQSLKRPKSWTGRLRGSPSRWKPEDGEAILQALQKAKETPIVRPVDPHKLARRPQALKSKIGSVTIPETEELPVTTATTSEIKDLVKHAEIQYLLLQLGSDMGFDVWVARNDRNREVNGKRFSELFKVKDSLPLQFDEATTKTIEYIDVLWLKGSAIVAAFEVESTTSIYSGLLRMSDLIAMQPNLNIPLYLVAPDERRNRVFEEINRPTFSRLSPPLARVCRYISFTTLKERLDKVAPFVRYLKSQFLEELSEVCGIEEA